MSVNNPGGSPIKSIQRGTIAHVMNAQTTTATITSVSTSKSVVNFLGVTTTATTTYAASTEAQPSRIEVRLSLTNSTTVTASIGIAGGGADVTTISYEVVEYV